MPKLLGYLPDQKFHSNHLSEFELNEANNQILLAPLVIFFLILMSNSTGRNKDLSTVSIYKNIHTYEGKIKISLKLVK